MLKRTGFKRKIGKPLKRTSFKKKQIDWSKIDGVKYKEVERAFNRLNGRCTTPGLLVPRNLQRKAKQIVKGYKPKKPKAHDAGWWQKKCDNEMQDINRLLNKKCEVSSGPCQTGHHFVTKALSSWLRYKFENLIPISFPRHFDHHQKSDPSVVEKVIRLRGNEWVEWIEQHRRLPQQTGVKYYQDIYNWLLTIKEHILYGELEKAKKLMKSDGTEEKKFIKFRDEMA